MNNYLAHNSNNPHTSHILNLQNVPSPDFTPEVGYAVETASFFSVNFGTIMVSIFLFLAVLSWFDFIQSTFYEALGGYSDTVSTQSKFWYAILISIFSLACIGLIVIIKSD